MLGAAPGAAAQQAAPTVGAPSEVAVAVDYFGAANVARPGEWTGVRLRLTDSSDRARNALVRLGHPNLDPDGDAAQVQREVTLNPGVAQSVWLYFRSPWTLDPASPFTVTITEADNAESASAAGGGRQIGSARIAPGGGSVISPAHGLMGVIGRAPAAGLTAYSIRAEQTNHSGTSHELVEVITGVVPADLPDRWMGLRQFEALVWLEGDPSTLSDAQARAIREWVMRGGHLIVSVPSIGQAWASPRNNPLFGILPAVRFDRVEGLDLRTLGPLLSPRLPPGAPMIGAVHALRPNDDALVSDAAVILASPDGKPLVVRRLLGAGATTLIGVDLSDLALGARVDPQLFWHRVTGKRFDVLTHEEMRALRDSPKRADFRMREPAWLDIDIPAQIVKEGRASVGVLLGLFVFATYLLLAGPIGFAALKRRKQTHHAWLAFVAVAGLFTMVAWGGATALRPTRAEIQHLTVLNHVYGQPVQSASVWFAALLPGYDDRTLSVGEPGEDAQWVQALFPWEDPSTTVRRRFPDARPYAIDARSPDSITLPARSTVKQMRAEWLGGPRWSMPTPLDGAITLAEGADRTQVVGRLAHGLPGPLRNVRLVLVRRQKPLMATLGENGPTLSITSAWSLTGVWAPGEALDLSTLGGASQGDAYFERLATDGRLRSAAGETRPDTVSAGSRFEALTFYSALRQPDYFSRSITQQPMLQRREMHGLDLSFWFTQPAFIIVGELEDAPSPAPLRIDGEPAPTKGRTLVRWIYPLNASPPAPFER